MRRRLVLLTVAAVLAVVAAACGVDDSSDFRPLSPADVAELQATSSTTTTSTTSTTTPPPTTTTPETTLTVLETTTTLAPTEPVELFYVSGELLQPVEFPLTVDPGPEQVLEALVAGLDTLGLAATGLRSAIPAGAQFSVSVNAGIAYVEMSSESLTQVATDGRLQFGQIVLTLVNNVRGIGQVKFSVDGSAITIEGGDGSQIDASSSASRDDYIELVAG
jgi:hypothetical protein